MKKIFSFIVMAILVAMSGQAQLTSGNSEKRCDVSYPIADLSVCLTSNYNARIVSKYVTDALISRLDMEYDASNSDYMIKSMEVSVYRYKKGSSGLVGDVPPEEQTKVERVQFVPTDDTLQQFKASLNIGENGWDKIVIRQVPNSSEIIKKSDYKRDRASMAPVSPRSRASVMAATARCCSRAITRVLTARCSINVCKQTGISERTDC